MFRSGYDDFRCSGNTVRRADFHVLGRPRHRDFQIMEMSAEPGRAALAVFSTQRLIVAVVAGNAKSPVDDPLRLPQATRAGSGEQMHICCNRIDPLPCMPRAHRAGDASGATFPGVRCAFRVMRRLPHAAASCHRQSRFLPFACEEFQPRVHGGLQHPGLRGEFAKRRPERGRRRPQRAAAVTGQPGRLLQPGQALVHFFAQGSEILNQGIALG